MSNAMYLGTSIDNPPLEVACESRIGQAVNHLRHGRRIPLDIAQDLMEEGIDLPALASSAVHYEN